jgi:hypothetical protein
MPDIEQDLVVRVPVARVFRAFATPTGLNVDNARCCLAEWREASSVFRQRRSMFVERSRIQRTSP